VWLNTGGEAGETTDYGVIAKTRGGLFHCHDCDRACDEMDVED
jgi:hypothetical protein